MDNVKDGDQRRSEDDAEEEREWLVLSYLSSEEDAVALLVRWGERCGFSIEPDESQACERGRGGKSSSEDAQVREIH